MSIYDRVRLSRCAPLAAALVLLGALVFAPAVAADTSGTVVVTASVATEMSLTLCDTEANFGDGLTSAGATPSNTSDAIGVTSPSSNPAQGRYYSWTPSCQASGTGVFWRIVSTSAAWRLTPCATGNAGPGASPTLSVANSLRWDALPLPLTTYEDALGSFGACPGGNGFGYIGNPGTAQSPFHLYLRVAPSDQAGTFSATVNWTLTPQ